MKKEIKDFLIEEMKAHKKADVFISGKYGEMNGTFKGCSVGCANYSLGKKLNVNIEYNDHAALAKHTDTPVWLHRLQDWIFEKLDGEDQLNWPLRFWQSVPIGEVDWIKKRHQFLYYLISICKYDKNRYPDVKKVIEKIKKLHGRVIDGGEVSKGEWSSARSAAESARSVTWSSARSAAESAAWSAAISAVESAAWSAARSAAWSAAESAAMSAAWSAAESTIVKMSKKLLKIIEEKLLREVLYSEREN